MTGIPLSAIPGCVVKDVHENCDCEDGEGCRYFADSIEDFIEKQGSIRLTLSRERLTKVIADYCNKNSLLYDGCKGLANNIISSLKDLIIVVK